MKQSTKGFSLSELLIVVIVIGILAAVVLPRYNKSLETRKTTEAENIMEAVRTEQERRCALSKTYAGDIAQLTDIVPNATTGNFTYSVSGTGVLASSQGSYNYTLKIPSYADGRICCDGDDCSKLNKDYPTCDDLINNTSDYDADTTCLSAIESEEGVDVIQGGGKTLLEPELGDVYEAPELECRSTTSEFSPCPGGCAIRWRHCQSDNTWGDWGACDASEVEPREEPGCGCQGRGSRTQICEVNSTYPNGHWVDSGECNVLPCECQSGQTEQRACGCQNQGRQNYRCGNDGSWVASGQCKFTPPNQNPITWTDQGECTQDVFYEDCGCRHKGTKYRRCNTQTCLFYTGSNTYTECLRNGQVWQSSCECISHASSSVSTSNSFCIDAPMDYGGLHNTYGTKVCRDRTDRYCPIKLAKMVKYCDHWKWWDSSYAIMCPSPSVMSAAWSDIRSKYLTAWSQHNTTVFPVGKGHLFDSWWNNNTAKRDTQINEYMAVWMQDTPKVYVGGQQRTCTGGYSTVEDGGAPQLTSCRVGSTTYTIQKLKPDPVDEP